VLCSAVGYAFRPEDNELIEIWCEKPPLHLPPHHGHLFYKEDDGTVTSRCVVWGN
jgi:hypothetical protein